jgi:hypothetical protein
LEGFRLADLGEKAQGRLWLRGGFLLADTAKSEHQAAELNPLLFKNGVRIGVECKRTDAPTLTQSMQIAMRDLKLNHLLVVYPGEHRYAISEKVEAIPLAQLVGASKASQAVFKKRLR